MYNLLLYKVYICFVKLELQLLNKQNHSADKGENFCIFREFFGCFVCVYFIYKSVDDFVNILFYFILYNLIFYIV